MFKITNQDLINDLGVPKQTFYDLKKRSPRQVELMKKGLLAEKLLTERSFEAHIKPDNKKA